MSWAGHCLPRHLGYVDFPQVQWHMCRQKVWWASSLGMKGMPLSVGSMLRTPLETFRPQPAHWGLLSGLSAAPRQVSLFLFFWEVNYLTLFWAICEAGPKPYLGFPFQKLATNHASIANNMPWYALQYHALTHACCLSSASGTRSSEVAKTAHPGMS